MKARSLEARAFFWEIGAGIWELIGMMKDDAVTETWRGIRGLRNVLNPPDYTSFEMQERSFDINMYDTVCKLAQDLNLGIAPEETGGCLGKIFSVHLTQHKRIVATLQHNGIVPDKVIIDSNHPNADQYLEAISSLYSEPQEERKSIQVNSLGEISSLVERLKDDYPRYVIRDEVWERIRKFRGHQISNLGRFPNLNNRRTWTIALNMPDWPGRTFDRKDYSDICLIAQELGLRIKQERGRERILLRQDITGVAVLADTFLALNLEHPDVDMYFERFSELYKNQTSLS